MSDDIVQVSAGVNKLNSSLPKGKKLKVRVYLQDEENNILFQVEARDHLDELDEILSSGYNITSKVYRYLKRNTILYTMNECHTTPKEMADKLNASTASVYAAIYHLKSHGVIRRSKIGVYYINPRYFTVFGTKNIKEARKKWNEKGNSNG